MKEENRVVKYDNKFNKTSLSLLTKVESDVLLSVLSRMDKMSSEDDRYVAEFTFKEIREMTGSKHLKASRIKNTFDTLLDTKVEFFTGSTYNKGNLFSHYSLEDKSTAKIVLTKNMTKQLIPIAKEYTILKLDEYINLPNNYSKEVYRLLRQFRHSGVALISKKDLYRILNPPKSYNEYDFIRKVLLPSIEYNKEYFQDLTINLNGNRLPNVIKFIFKPHERMKSKDYSNVAENGESKSDEEDLIEYIKRNT